MRMRDPSSGGNGIMLNAARLKLTSTKISRNCSASPRRTPADEERRQMPAAIAPSTTFESGPANATRAMLPCRPNLPAGRSRKSFTGTGLPQAIPGRPSAIRTNNKAPTGSKCTTGFRLTRPSRRAVSSPSIQAVQACMNSWTVIAMMKVTMIATNDCGSKSPNPGITSRRPSRGSKSPGTSPRRQVPARRRNRDRDGRPRSGRCPGPRRRDRPGGKPPSRTGSACGNGTRTAG